MIMQKRWSVWKRLVIYPVFLLAAVELLCIWSVIDETISPPRMIEGRPDDGLRYAGMILGFLAAVLYLAYVVLVGVVRFVVTPFKPLQAPKLNREQALKDLDSFVAELDVGQDGLDWAPALLSMLRDFRREAAEEIPDEQRLAVLREQVHAYFKEHRFLKGIPNVLWDVDTICKHDT